MATEEETALEGTALGDNHQKNPSESGNKSCMNNPNWGVSTETKPANPTPNRGDSDSPQLMSHSTSCGSTQELTKNQLRKLKKRQVWEDNKEQRLELRREKRKERRKRKQGPGPEGGEEQESEVITIAKKRRRKMDDPDASGVRVVIDCGFDDLMEKQDITKLSKQIQRSYACNRTSDTPFQFYICNFASKCQARFQTCMAEYPSWDVNFRKQGLNDVFGSDGIVYLTSESPNVLKDLDPGKVYVIGGLVDHNHHKGVCYERAVSKGWDHAQLPITEFMDFKARKVLTVNHVFEILVAYIETSDWKAAFNRVIPQRKFHTMSRRERRRREYKLSIGAAEHPGRTDEHATSDEHKVMQNAGSKDNRSTDGHKVLEHDGRERKDAGITNDNAGSSDGQEVVEHDGRETNDHTETEQVAKDIETTLGNNVT